MSGSKKVNDDSGNETQIARRATDGKPGRMFFFLVLVFAAVYYIARIAIFFAATAEGMEFEREQSILVENVVSYSFLAIGVFGLLLLPGVYLRKSWGLWGTIAVSAYTIAFDMWAFTSVQSSAAAGIIPAGILIGYIVLTNTKRSVQTSSHLSG